MTKHPDIARVAAIIADVAAEAIMPRFRKLAAADVSEKTGPHDLATVADTEAERLLAMRLQALAPGSTVVGEEAVSADETVMDRLGGPDPVWIVDPIDGTTNFATGLPMFGCMVAYAIAGETRAAWIHDPVHGRTAMAERGGGAWLDGRRASTVKPRNLAAMHGTLSIRSGTRERAAQLGARANRVASVLILRCAAHEYMAMLEGSSHFAIYNRIMPWDHAPGAMMVEEAGGFAARIDGRRYRPGDPVAGEPLLVAPDREHWEMVRECFFRP
ncbi:MAG TPA: inositol monophosphatase [Candidatus Cybelea sp.]|nr:inositol monophosphatase [Candidatus Cybelea sp.]